MKQHKLKGKIATPENLKKMKEENGTINYEEFDLIPVFYSPFDSVIQEVKEKKNRNPVIYDFNTLEFIWSSEYQKRKIVGNIAVYHEGKICRLRTQQEGTPIYVEDILESIANSVILPENISKVLEVLDTLKDCRLSNENKARLVRMLDFAKSL